MQYLNFGRTGHKSSRLLFGAAALHQSNPKDTSEAIDLILESGINHIDTAASYGLSEKLLGPFIAQYRKEFFLATKTGERTKKKALEELEKSLELLKTDQVDLWQMHNLAGPDEWEVAMGPDGVLEAFVEAREKGLVRFLGVTGHGLGIPEMHLKSLDRFDFDSVLLPYNYALVQNSNYKQAYDEIREYCKKGGKSENGQIAFQCIKTNCRSPWGDQKPYTATWYKPFEDPNHIRTAICYALMQEEVFLNSTGDLGILPLVIQAVQDFDPSVDYSKDMEKVAVESSMETLFPAD